MGLELPQTTRFFTQTLLGKHVLRDKVRYLYIQVFDRCQITELQVTLALEVTHLLTRALFLYIIPGKTPNTGPSDVLDILKQLLPLTILAVYNPSILRYQLCLAANALTVMANQESIGTAC